MWDAHLTCQAIEAIGRYITAWSVMHDHCNARPVVTFPATEHCHCSLADTHLQSH